MFCLKLLRDLLVPGAVVTFGLCVADTGQASGDAEDNACPVADVEYNVVANVVIRNTALGAANGVYSLGSGKMTLRIAKQAGPSTVRLMSYELMNRLTIEAKVAMLSTRVVTLAHTSVAHDACNGSAQGTLHDGTVTWNTKVAGYHSDGTMECTGSMCGGFGAPPRGISPFHDAPPAIYFSPFTFSSDGSTFTMPYTFASKSDSPRQTTYLALSGRRVKQFCASPNTVEACSR
jgi:hypothetical protein